MKTAKNLGRTCRYGIRQEIEKGQTDRKDNNCYRTGQTGTGQEQERIWYDDSEETKRGEQNKNETKEKRYQAVECLSKRHESVEENGWIDS